MFRHAIPAALVAALMLTGLSSMARPLAAQVGPAPAQTSPEMRALFDAMGLYDILEIMSAEGRAAAPDLEDELFPGQGGGAWVAVVSSIYALDKMTAAFEAAVPLDRLGPEALAAVQAFFDSEAGVRIVAGEVAARRAFLDPALKQAATDLAQDRAAAGDPRLDLLTEFISANDLVERNVSGALNSNLAFYVGLSEAGAFSDQIPEELMLADVWGQEPQIRSDTLEWLYAYQLLAYEGVSDADLRAYIALSQTPAGQALTAALFAAFDVVFEGISRDLGRAAAGFIAGQDL
jgi:hypothetical protein